MLTQLPLQLPLPLLALGQAGELRDIDVEFAARNNFV